MLRYSHREHITFTRGRVGRKNDNAFVEQKNWSVIRRLVGDLRFDTQRQVHQLNALYAVYRLYVNHFLPVTKLVTKVREGNKVKRVFDDPKTPYQRVLDSLQVSDKDKHKLCDSCPTRCRATQTPDRRDDGYIDAQQGMVTFIREVTIGISVTFIREVTIGISVTFIRDATRKVFGNPSGHTTFTPCHFQSPPHQLYRRLIHRVAFSARQAAQTENSPSVALSFDTAVETASLHSQADLRRLRINRRRPILP